MSKIIVRRQEYANNGTHANEIEAVVKENLIANTLSSATDIAPSVGLLNSVKGEIDSQLLASALATKIGVYLDKTYTINVDTIQGDGGYIYRCLNGSGTLPTTVLGGNAFLLIGFSNMNSAKTLPAYGVQLAIGFGSNKIAIRNASYSASGSAWGAWRTI